MADDQPTVRRILTLDGGGVRGVLTLKLLESLEARITAANSPERNSSGQRPTSLLDFFDMVAGTSTGAIIAGLLQMGHRPSEILNLYTELCPQVFRNRRLSLIRAIFLGSKYPNKQMKHFLAEYFQEKRLWELPKDIMIVARDMVQSESTFFTAFKLSDSGASSDRNGVYGTYKDIRLKDAVLSSASAPVYFPCHARFVDGGVGSYNNSCLEAAVEALAYSAPSAWELWDTSHPGQTAPPDIKTWQRDIKRYTPGRVIVYSFGTGHEKPLRQTKDVKKIHLPGWAQKVSGELMGDINENQSKVASRYVDILRGLPPSQVLTPLFRLHRYQLYFTREGVQQVGATWADDISSIEMDDAGAIPVLKDLGAKMAQKITAEGLWDEEETLAIPSPRPLPRRVPGNVFVELGRPRYERQYAGEVVSELDGTGW